MAIRGGCLCGKVRYEITGRLFDASNCHCSMCRRQHGAVYATYVDFNPDEFNWVSGKDLVKVYEPSPDGGWCFCSECGSSLAGADQRQNHLDNVRYRGRRSRHQSQSHISS